MASTGSISRLHAVLLGALGATLTGLVPLFVRASDVGPIATAAWRFGIALGVLVPTALVRWMMKKEVQAIDLSSNSLLLGALFGLDVMLWQSSLALTSVSVAAFLANLAPVFVVLLRWLFLSRQPRATHLVAVLFALVGAYLLSSPAFALNQTSALGVSCALGASISFALFLMTSERSRPSGDLPRYTGLTLVAFIVVVALNELLKQPYGPVSAGGYLPLIGLALLIHCLAFFLFFASSARVGAIGSSVINLLQPVSATILGMMFLGEGITSTAIIGMCAIMIALLLVAFLQDRASPV